MPWAAARANARGAQRGQWSGLIQELRNAGDRFCRQRQGKEASTDVLGSDAGHFGEDQVGGDEADAGKTPARALRPIRPR